MLTREEAQVLEKATQLLIQEQLESEHDIFFIHYPYNKSIGFSIAKGGVNSGLGVVGEKSAFYEITAGVSLADSLTNIESEVTRLLGEI
jgi:hypothetical protein